MYLFYLVLVYNTTQKPILVLAWIKLGKQYGYNINDFSFTDLFNNKLFLKTV